MTNPPINVFFTEKTLPLNWPFIMVRQPIDDQSIDLAGAFLMKKMTGSHHPMKHHTLRKILNHYQSLENR
jgi:hypothetical protein